jgi:hypothetical protein
MRRPGGRRAAPALQLTSESGERVRHVGPHVAVVREDYPVDGLEGPERRFGHLVVMGDQRALPCPASACDASRGLAFPFICADVQILPTERKIIVIPWTTMSTRFAVESWDWFLPLATTDTTQVEAFYQNHVDQSPEGNQTP